MYVLDMLSLVNLPLYALIFIFIIAAVIITFAGTRLAHVAEKLAVQTGLGQAIVGAVFVGISTSISGTILSFYSAALDHPSLSIGNSTGGIAAQIVFLAVADLVYRKANLEHAAASLANLSQAALLIVLLSIPLVAMVGPDWTILHIHPASIILIAGYIIGLKIVKDTKAESMWKPLRTRDTQVEKKTKPGDQKETYVLLLQFGFLAMVLCALGVVLADAGTALSNLTGLEESIVGGLFTSITTSLPELVITITAVRRGALNLAVGNIIGGNSFDALFLAGSDVFYINGSLYHQFQNDHILMVSMSIFMMGILMLGLLRREKAGPGRIGFESVLVLVSYFLLTVMMLA